MCTRYSALRLRGQIGNLVMLYLGTLSQDIKDTWRNTLMNTQNQIRLAEYQTCGQFLTPDMLTVGMGGQTAGEYRAQFYLWAILGAPLILSNDIRTMTRDDVCLICRTAEHNAKCVPSKSAYPCPALLW